MASAAAVAKAQLRAAVGVPPTVSPGRIAETLRRQPWYRQSRILFVTPSPLLRQVRINVLADGKTLLMPTPSLRRGFYRFGAGSVPFSKIPHAVTPKGAARYGRYVSAVDLARRPVEVAVAEAVLIDGDGNRLGAGDGFFDLALALLAAWGGLAAGVLVVGCVDHPDRLVADSLPTEPFDVPVNVAVTGDGVHRLRAEPSRPAIVWERLSRRQIRRIDPLWKLWVRRSAGER